MAELLIILLSLAAAVVVDLVLVLQEVEEQEDTYLTPMCVLMQELTRLLLVVGELVVLDQAILELLMELRQLSLGTPHSPP
jgi:hypothetical protein